MNNSTIESTWADIKNKIRTKWNKFNDTELESFKGDLSQLSSKVETTYGITKDQAERQCDEFKKSLVPAAERPEEAPAVTKKAV